MRMGILSYFLNLLGLICDIVGVIMLFKLRDQGLKTLGGMISPSYMATHMGRDVNREIDNAFEKLAKNINTSIQDTNEKNKSILQKSSKWLCLIIVGFAFQFSSSCFQLTAYLGHSRSEKQNKSLHLHN